MTQEGPQLLAGELEASSGERVSLAELRAGIDSAVRLVRALPAVLWQASGSDLGPVLAEVDQLAAVAGGIRVAIAAEALERGEIASSQCVSTAAWVAQHASSLGLGSGAGQVAKLIEQTHRKPALARVLDAVVAGALPVPVAQVVLSEFAKLREQIVPDARELVLDGLIRIGIEDGAREVRRLRTSLLARHGAADELQRDQDRAARLVALSHPVCTDDGVWIYRFTADAEAKAILEAAIGVLSAPWHPDGARDPRSAQQRRGQALVEVCRRVTAAAKAAGVFGGHPSTGDGTAAGHAQHESASPVHESGQDATAAGTDAAASDAAGDDAAGDDAAASHPAGDDAAGGCDVVSGPHVVSGPDAAGQDASVPGPTQAAPAAAEPTRGGPAGEADTADGPACPPRQISDPVVGDSPSNDPPASDSGGHQPASDSGGHQPASDSGGHQPPSDSGGHQPPSDSGGHQPPSDSGGDAPPGDSPGASLPPGDSQGTEDAWHESAGTDQSGNDPAQGDPLTSQEPRHQAAARDLPGNDPPPGFDPAMMRATLAGMGAGGAKAILMVTMSLTELTERVGAATVLGTTEDGTLLAPETARRIACDAGVIPVVLGSPGEVLDLGRTERLFSPAQARAVLLRDRQCSFPSCDIPAFWTQLHHVRHWADGGATDVGNAALLCARHHTIVHRDRLTATVSATGVRWDTTAGSYDHELTNRRTAAA